MSRQIDSSDRKKFFDLLYQKTGIYLYFVSMQILQNEEDAKEVFCETYRETFEKLDQLHSTSQLIETLYQKLSQNLANRLLNANPKLFDMYEVSADGFPCRELIPEKIMANPAVAKDLVNYTSGQLLIQEKICLYFYYFLNFNVKQIASVLHTSEKRINYFINSVQNTILLRLKVVFNGKQPIPTLPLEGIPNLSKLLLAYTEKEVKLPSDLQSVCWDFISAPQKEQEQDEIQISGSQQNLVVHTASQKPKHRIRSLLFLAFSAAVVVSCAILPTVFADTREQELYQDALKKNMAQIHSQSSAQEELPAGKEQSTAIYDPSNDPEMVNKLSLSQTSIALEVDETVTIELTVLPETAKDQSVLWVSDDKEVARVTADGKITGIGAGKCEITVTSKANPTVTAVITVTVTETEESSQEEESSEVSTYTPPASSEPSRPVAPPSEVVPSNPSEPSSSTPVEEPSAPESSSSPEEATSPEV